MEAFERTSGTRTQFAAPIADLGCIVRFDSFNNNSASFRFILDVSLQLIEAPVANPVVHSFTSFLFSYPFEVFHDDFVSVEFGNDLLTYVVVDPSHKPFFLSAQLFEKPFGRTSAFGLEFGTQISEFSFDLLDVEGLKKSAIAADSKVIYTEIDAKNFVLEISAFDNDFFSESEQEETSAFVIDSQQTFFEIPTKIFSIAFRDFNVEFLPAFDCGYAQDIMLEGCASLEVISYRSMFDDWFGFSFFYHSTSLFDACYSQLAVQSKGSQVLINKGVQSNIILDFVFPCSIYAELQTFSVNLPGFYYRRGCSDFDLSCCSYFHTDIKDKHIYISHAHMSSDQWSYVIIDDKKPRNLRKNQNICINKDAIICCIISHKNKKEEGIPFKTNVLGILPTIL